MNRDQLRRFEAAAGPAAAGAGEPRQLLGHLSRRRLPLRSRPARRRALRPRTGRGSGEPDAARSSACAAGSCRPARSPPATAVGYGASWRAAGPRRVATVAVGYADGYLRSLGNRATAFAGDTPCPLVGIVSMDTATFDVTDAPAGGRGRLPRADRARRTRSTRSPGEPGPSAMKSSPPSAAATPAPTRMPPDRKAHGMKVIVLGSGVIGVASAWYLAEAGHEVVVLDRQPGPALETSFANAGEISPGYASPWAAPGHPAEGAEVAVHAAQSALHPPDPEPRDAALRDRDAQELHRRGLRGE